MTETSLGRKEFLQSKPIGFVKNDFNGAWHETLLLNEGFIYRVVQDCQISQDLLDEHFVVVQDGNWIKRNKDEDYKVSNSLWRCISEEFDLDFLIELNDNLLEEIHDNYKSVYRVWFKDEDIYDVVDFINTFLMIREEDKEFKMKVYQPYIEGNYVSLIPFDCVQSDVDVELNYNDDFKQVHETVVDRLSTVEKGLYLFHGIPRTGKTTYIKYLSKLFPNKKFIFIDNSMIHYLLVDSSKLISLIKNDKSEKVLVLEDCEAYLKSRDISNNPQIVSTLLQLTDGILADLLKMPVICTYNSKDLKIDEALLGVGRLQVQYEFKALNKEKVNQLCKHLEIPELNKETVLSEVLNYHLLPIKEETVTRKIGF